MKISINKLNEFINENFEKFINEEEEVGTYESMKKYIDGERIRLKGAIDTDTKLKNVQPDPQERTIKEKQIKMNKEKLIKLEELQKDIDKKEADEKALKDKEAQEQQAGLSVSVSSEIEEQQMPAQQQNIPQITPKKKIVHLVHFDTKSEQPFDVKFSERGFSIQDTRLSFEILETAISKSFNIVLNNGGGLTLDPVKMQKILRYKDRW